MTPEMYPFLQLGKMFTLGSLSCDVMTLFFLGHWKRMNLNFSTLCIIISYNHICVLYTVVDIEYSHTYSYTMTISNRYCTRCIYKQKRYIYIYIYAYIYTMFTLYVYSCTHSMCCHLQPGAWFSKADLEPMHKLIILVAHHF